MDIYQSSKLVEKKNKKLLFLVPNMIVMYIFMTSSNTL